MKTAEVAELLQVDTSTLCRWRQAGVGPRPTWLTRSMPRYQRREVMAWLERMAS
ncbi:helix-turn-helix domain-containing protein [Phycicoccus sp. SLBN-51]|uniref:helix-turn-helix transcriptional regulator n=1 Tax=Phycicoccus sp. SLBN-51 TaxID=2768447 RepID=UPI0011527802|nr:helix-turn-helix domain-containing protein [Phycicoccus sp. SLBN-51]